MKNKRMVLVVSVILIGLFLIAGCGGSSAEFPSGYFVTEGFSDSGFKFNADGTWATVLYGKEQIHGTYEVNGNVFTELTNDVPTDDPVCKSPSKYEWSFDGSKLTFSLVEDECRDRAEAYTGAAHILQDK